MDNNSNKLDQVYGEMFQAFLEVSKRNDLTVVEALLILNKINEQQLIALVNYEKQHQKGVQ